MKKFIFLFCAFVAIQAQADMNCTSYTSAILGRDVQYCVDRSRPDLPATEGEPVAYFMHGMHSDALAWENNNYRQSLSDLRDQKSLKPMTFVSFDTSGESFFSDYPADDPSDTSAAYETWFTQEFIPFIENTLHVCHERKCRSIMGESMGGLGALKTALRHTELFSTIAVNSPALSPFETTGSFFDWVDYFSDTKIGFLMGFFVTWTFFDVFRSDEVMLQNNPTYLTENYSAPDPYPNLYFDMGGEDIYGFYVGYDLFKNALDRKGIPYSTVFEADGSHDMWARHASDALTFVQDHTQ